MSLKVSQSVEGLDEYFRTLSAYVALSKKSAAEVVRLKAVNLRIRLMKGLSGQAMTKGQAESEFNARGGRLLLRSKKGKAEYEARKNQPRSILLTRAQAIGVDPDKVKHMRPSFLARMLANKKELAARNSSTNYFGGSLRTPEHIASKMTGVVVKNSRSGRKLTNISISAQDSDESPEVVLLNDATGMKSVLVKKSILSAALQAETADMAEYVNRQLQKGPQ
jgi:hypothetical protein